MLADSTFTAIPNDPTGGMSAVNVASNIRQTRTMGPLIELGYRNNVTTSRATFDADGRLLVTTAFTSMRGLDDPTQPTGPNDIAGLRRAVAAERAELARDPNGRTPLADLDRMEQALASGNFRVVGNQGEFESAVAAREVTAGRQLFLQGLQEKRRTNTP